MNTYFPKMLLTGGQGQLSLALLAHANAPAWQLLAYSHAQFDITQSDMIINVLEKNQPHIVINTAAFTAVDKAEQEQAKALQINVEGTRNLAMACRQLHVPLIHLSTDYVFSGTQTTPYCEQDAIQPSNFYGHTKWLAEEAVREHCPQHLILRVSGVFSAYGQNFFKTILRLANERKQLRIVTDQITCPTYAGDIATAIFTLSHAILNNTHPAFGTYHFCSQPAVSWYDFACAIVEQAQLHHHVMVEEIQAITSHEYPTLAKRPAYSVLNCAKIFNDYQLSQPNWHTAIKTLLKE